jgi:DNA-binding transcriptional regulator of glucitol operon
LIDSGVHDLNELKRRSRAGMGPCQGRYCTGSLINLLRDHTDVVESTATSFTAQNPVKPVTVADIVEEQAEWRGYRAAAVPPKTTAAARESDVVDECDVAIVGAGVIGAATALYLARQNVNVQLLEAGECTATGGGYG